MWTQSPGASCFPRIQWVYMEGSIWAWQQGCIILYIAPGDNKIRCWEASRVTSNSFEASRKLQGYLVQPSTRKVMDIHNLWVFTRQDILYSILTRSVLATLRISSIRKLASSQPLIRDVPGSETCTPWGLHSLSCVLLSDQREYRNVSISLLLMLPAAALMMITRSYAGC